MNKKAESQGFEIIDFTSVVDDTDVLEVEEDNTDIQGLNIHTAKECDLGLGTDIDFLSLADEEDLVTAYEAYKNDLEFKVKQLKSKIEKTEKPSYTKQKTVGVGKKQKTVVGIKTTDLGKVDDTDSLLDIDIDKVNEDYEAQVHNIKALEQKGKIDETEAQSRLNALDSSQKEYLAYIKELKRIENQGVEEKEAIITKHTKERNESNIQALEKEKELKLKLAAKTAEIHKAKYNFTTIISIILNIVLGILFSGLVLTTAANVLYLYYQEGISKGLIDKLSFTLVNKVNYGLVYFKWAEGFVTNTLKLGDTKVYTIGLTVVLLIVLILLGLKIIMLLIDLFQTWVSKLFKRKKIGE